MADRQPLAAPIRDWWIIPVVIAVVGVGLGSALGEVSTTAAAALIPLLAVHLAGALLAFRAIRKQVGQAAGAAEAALEESLVLQQREMLLATVLEHTPAAMVLCDLEGVVTYANRVAREQLLDGKHAVGKRLVDVVGERAPKLREVVDVTGDSMIALDAENGRETFLVSTRNVVVGGQERRLHMIRRMTGELNRNEVEVWKKLIRVLSHEMNNSLAPISSLVHSARVIAKSPDKLHKLDGVFDTIAERAEHLRTFLGSYAEFARLPKPVKRTVQWQDLLDRLGKLHDFELVGEVPPRPAFIDPSQLEQVVINVIKNAEETGSRPEVSLVPKNEGVCIHVSDRGPGMSPEVLEKALLPFFSTKSGGTGLGLALSRDIVEAHGGELRLENREGGGLTVHCWLPDAESASEA